VTIFTTDQQLQLRVDDLAWREVQDELVVLEVTTATYLSLNGSAKMLWHRLVDGATVAELRASLVTTYGISDGQAASDVGEFLDVLIERGLLVAG
jgi:hypothetical protein